MTGSLPSQRRCGTAVCSRAEGVTDADSSFGPVWDLNLGSGPRRRQTVRLRPPELAACSYLPDWNNEWAPLWLSLLLIDSLVFYHIIHRGLSGEEKDELIHRPLPLATWWSIHRPLPPSSPHVSTSQPSAWLFLLHVPGVFSNLQLLLARLLWVKTSKHSAYLFKIIIIINTQLHLLVQV